MQQYPKFTVRLRANQELVLTELSTALHTTKSVLLRAIISDWLTKNEDCIYRLIEGKNNNNDYEEDSL